MPHRIPKKKEVVRAIIDALRDAGCVDSLDALRDMVIHHLREVNPEYTISTRRLRRIIATVEDVEMRISASESEAYTRALGGKDALNNMSHCPVCGAKLKPVRNQTIYGWTVVIEKKCPVCGYWTGRKIRKPYKYEFCLKPSGRRKKE